MTIARTPDLQLQVSTGYRHILKLALPIVASMIVPQLNFVINNIFIGHFLPAEYLGVAAITGVYYLIFACIGLGFNNGLQALIARRAGENRLSAIGSLFQNGVVISIIISLACIAITYAVVPSLLHLALENPDHADVAIRFLHIRIWGLPFLFLYQMRNALLVGTNNSKLLIVGTLAETLINIFFDYTLISGKLHFPNMGFNGAALSSVFAEIAGLVAIFGIMHLQGVSQKLYLFKSTKINKDEIRLILVQSLPLILQFAISLASWELFYVLIERNCTITDLAVSNTMRNVFGLFGCFGWAFAASCSAMVSNVIGQKRDDEVIPLVKRIIRLAISIALFLFVLINLMPGLFLSVYGQDDLFIKEGIPVLRVVSVAMVMQPVATCWLNAVVGTGNSKKNLYTEMMAITVYIIYVWLVLEVFHLPVAIGWFSEWIYWIIMFTPSFLYMKSGRWKGKVI